MDWVERSLGSLSWKNLTSLSLPDCNLKRIELPHESLPFLMTLDVSGNQLSSLAGLGSLPKYAYILILHLFNLQVLRKLTILLNSEGFAFLL